MVKQTWKLHKEQKNQIVIDYLYNQDLTCKNLSEKYKISRQAVFGILKRNSIAIRNDQSILQRKYTLDESFFEKIDTEEKAYFLGWLYADGCNHEPSNNIIVVLQEGDKEILYKLNNLVKSSRPIKFIKRESDLSNRKNQYRLVISSKKMSKDLSKLGCFQAKSLILKFPNEEQVPKHLLKHFTRGFWEGDGSIFYSRKMRKNGQKRFDYGIGFTSTKDFCISLRDFLKVELDIFTNISDGNSKTGITTNLQYHRLEDVLKFMDWIYHEANIKLERKWLKYQAFLKELEK